MIHKNSMSRRNFLKIAAAAGVSSFNGFQIAGCATAQNAGLIERIEPSVIWPGRTAGTAWFHPRACMLPSASKSIALMTCQAISGSDVFGQVYWSRSKDNGRAWTEPQPIPSFGRQMLPTGIEEGVCDVVPEYHAKTNTVLAIGHNVYYKDNVLTLPYENRYPVYVVRDENGNWSNRKKLEWDHPETSGIYTCGCSQRVTLENGHIIIALSFGPKERKDRKVCSVLCSFDGKNLNIINKGNELELAVKRGLLEPSLAQFKDRYFMTIRAEDRHGYLSVSNDGLNWEQQQPWRWDDEEPLIMSTTQQHWLVHSHGLLLVYTRKAKQNVNVMRWRSPLYIAQVDTVKQCLIRDSEKIVFPLIGDGINDPDHVARMGNFHVVNASHHESWVTVGETLPHDKWKGDTLLSRVIWN